MSYKIGQFKRTQYKEPYTDISKILEFEDQYLNTTPYGLNARDGMIVGNFQKDKIYHIKCNVKPSGNYTGLKQFKLKLKDSELKYQSLKVYDLISSNTVAVEVVFIPKYDFKNLVFEAIRDATLINDKNAFFYCTGITFARTLANVVDLLPAKVIKRVGIQGPEGLIFAINGEMIKMGKSRIYMSKEMDITSIGFYIGTDNSLDEDGNKIPYFDNKQFFVMDYQY